jgi:hypothetical protein
MDIVEHGILLERSSAVVAPRETPLRAVTDPVWDGDALHPVLCPHCWCITAIWLAHPDGKTDCVVCGGEVALASGDA